MDLFSWRKMHRVVQEYAGNLEKIKFLVERTHTKFIVFSRVHCASFRLHGTVQIKLSCYQATLAIDSTIQPSTVGSRKGEEIEVVFITAPQSNMSLPSDLMEVGNVSLVLASLTIFLLSLSFTLHLSPLHMTDCLPRLSTSVS